MTRLVRLLLAGLFFLFSALLKDHAYDDMAKDEINHISEMVFETMYTAMLAGSDREGIEEAARRMNQTGPGMLISVVRGEVVAEKFGDIETDFLRRKNDLAIIDVGLKTEGRVPLREFRTPGEEQELSVGDEVEVFLDRIENEEEALGGLLVVPEEELEAALDPYLTPIQLAGVEAQELIRDFKLLGKALFVPNAK